MQRRPRRQCRVIAQHRLRAQEDVPCFIPSPSCYDVKYGEAHKHGLQRSAYEQPSAIPVLRHIFDQSPLWIMAVAYLERTSVFPETAVQLQSRFFQPPFASQTIPSTVSTKQQFLTYSRPGVRPLASTWAALPTPASCYWHARTAA